MASARKQRPEALATFAEAARAKGKKPDDLGLVANAKTAPIPTDSKLKDDAATRVLNEGATGKDRNSEEAIDRLPDRIIESRDGTGREDAARDEETADESYDATRDPRTGRPPMGDKAEELKQDRLAGKAARADADDAFDEADVVEELDEGKLSGEELDEGGEAAIYDEEGEPKEEYQPGGGRLGP